MQKVLFAMLFFCTLSVAAQETILINNVRIFNSTDEKLMTGNVLVHGFSSYEKSVAIK